MAIAKKQPKSVNLLDSVYSPTDAVSKVYTWLVSIGKYLLIFVEIIVLGVFFSRFILDKQNNDLTEEINSQVSLLSEETWKANGVLYSNYQTLLADASKIRVGQKINSSTISELISGVPEALALKDMSFNQNRISLSLTARDLDEVRTYETALKSNEQYSDVKFSITKEEENIFLSVSFNLNQGDK